MEYDGEQDFLYKLGYDYENHLVVINADSNIIFEESYYPEDFQYIIDSIEGDLPVKVISHKAHYDAFVTYKILESIICLAIVLDFLIAAVIYAIKIMK